MVLKFMRQIVLPAINYGAYMDSEDAFDEYLEIDKEFINFGTFLFNEIPDKDELLKFLVQPRANGGLALQLPGFFFQHFNLVNRNQEDIEGGYI